MLEDVAPVHYIISVLEEGQPSEWEGMGREIECVGGKKREREKANSQYHN